MSPSLAPVSMNAAITNVYAVIASWTPWIVVSRSATIWLIETFMTLLSSTITNCAAARIRIAVQLFIGGPSLPRDLGAVVGMLRGARRRASAGPGERTDQVGVRRPLPDQHLSASRLVVSAPEFR